jgi:hypothetical protein
MLFLNPNEGIAFELNHRAFWLRGIPSPLLVAAAKDGRISLCRLSPEPSISRLSAPGKVAAVSPHPSRPLLALVEHGSGKLFVLGFDGSVMCEEPAPRLPEGPSEWMTADCQFDVSGTYLLCAATVSEDRIEVQLRETDRWSVISRAVVEDPFGASSASFHPTAGSDTWALWLGAGQDGQRVLWVMRDDTSLRTMIEPRLENRGPLAFSPSGDEFLTIGEPGGPLERYAYHPPTELLGVCESPYDAPFGPYFCYLDNAQALAFAENGQMAVVDTRSMRVVEELAIEGHEPRPIEEYYPRLVGDGSLCTDISYIKRVGDYLIVVHPLHQPSEPGSDGRVKFEEWRDGLLCFPIDYVLERHGA